MKSILLISVFIMMIFVQTAAGQGYDQFNVGDHNTVDVLDMLIYIENDGVGCGHFNISSVVDAKYRIRGGIPVQEPLVITVNEYFRGKTVIFSCQKVGGKIYPRLDVEGEFKD